MLADGKVVALADISLSDTGEWLTGGGVDYAEAFWQEYLKKPDTAFAIAYAKEGVYFVREGGSPVLLHEVLGTGFDSIQELEKHLASLVYKNI